MDVEELDVFKLSPNLVLEIYKLTDKFPQRELFSLTLQMRRAASSVPMNIVEGANRKTKAEYRHFLGIAKGSASEVKYQLLLASDLGYIERGEAEKLRSEFSRVLQMLTKLIKALQN